MTEHRIQLFELAPGKDPLLLHTLTFLTDYARDWLKHLTFEVEVKGEPVLAGLTAASGLLLTFALREKRLHQLEAEICLKEDGSGMGASLAARGSSLWAATSDNKVSVIKLK